MSHDIRTLFSEAAAAAGAEQDATVTLRRWDQTTALPGLIKTLGKMELPPTLAEPARQAVSAETDPTGFSADFLVLHGLLGVPARDGSDASVAVLRDYVAAHGPDHADHAVRRSLDGVKRVIAANAGSSAVSDLADEISRSLADAQSENEAADWAREYAPQLKGGEWEVAIWLDPARKAIYFGDNQSGPRLHLAIGPRLDDGWVLNLREPHGGRVYVAVSGGYRQSPGWELPALTRLNDFPAWLIEVEQALGVTFPPEFMDVRAGRLRSVAKSVASWIAAARDDRPE